MGYRPWGHKESDMTKRLIKRSERQTSDYVRGKRSQGKAQQVPGFEAQVCSLCSWISK